MPLENGDYTIPHHLSTGVLAVDLPVLTPSETDKLCVPVQLSNGDLSVVEVETAQADDELAFPAMLSTGVLALVKEAAAGPTATGTDTGTGSATPANSCNSCDPPIPDTLYVTFAGLAGDFAAYNGKQTVVWRVGCTWEDIPLGGWVFYAVRFEAGQWQTFVTPVERMGACAYLWQKAAGDDCEPEGGSYIFSLCFDSDCVDGDSCEDSSGATAVVSTS